MKKLIAFMVTALAFIADNEILTLAIIAAGALFVVIFVFSAWAKIEKPKNPCLFNTEWGKKK